MLEFLCQSATPAFLEIQNDFGLTPLKAAEEKAKLYEEVVTVENSDMSAEEIEKF